MQEVSQAWIEAQKKTFVPESYVEVSLNVGDPNSQADASSTSNGEMEFSSASKLVDGTDRTPKALATLEPNIWLLDGSRMIVPDGDYDNEGYIGTALSNGDGLYEGVLPTITVSFSKVFTELIPGVSITWATAYGEFARRYRVTAYANGVQTFQGEFINSIGEMTSVANADIDNYDQIVIEVLEWCLPGRRARIESVTIGIVKTYTRTDLMSFEHENTVDPLSFELPKNEIRFKIKNLNGEYNPDNPSGAERYLMERQAITARYGYKLNGSIEWIKAGTFYMSEWETPQNGIEAGFTARDSLEYMSDLYTGASTGTLYDIATAALQQADLPKLHDGSDRWVIDSSLRSITAATDADLSQNSIMEVLQYVANAGCCVFYQDRDGVLHIEPLPDGQTDYEINRFVSYSTSEISLTKQLKAVNINNGQYVLTVGKVGETQPVSNPLISASRAPIVAQWIADYLVNRKILTGEFRADPRLDALDRVINQNQFAQTVVLVTEVRFTYNGAFRGSYEGRAGV